MPDRIGRLFELARPQLATAGLVASLLAVSSEAGWPQAAPAPTLGLQSPAQQPLAPQPAPQQGEPAPREENPGLINEIGKLFEKSKSLLPPLKSPGETLELAKPSTMVSGRTACLVSSNGAPDCKAGADRLCQSKGYKEGKSLDTDAAEKCSPKAYVPGYKRQAGDCKTENYVTRALCQ
jgi:hypothetical protein